MFASLSSSSSSSSSSSFSPHGIALIDLVIRASALPYFRLNDRLSSSVSPVVSEIISRETAYLKADTQMKPISCWESFIHKYPYITATSSRMSGGWARGMRMVRGNENGAQHCLGPGLAYFGQCSADGIAPCPVEAPCSHYAMPCRRTRSPAV